MVGVAGFEPTASSSRTKRATKLRHTPISCDSINSSRYTPEFEIAHGSAREFTPAGWAATGTTSNKIASGGQNVRSGM